MKAPANANEVRRGIVDALRLDLIGPGPADTAHHEELLPQAPSRWYLTGWLVPQGSELQDRTTEDADDELDSGVDTTAGDDGEVPDKPAARKQLLPSSIGLSLLVEPETEAVEVRVDWGEYAPEEVPVDGQGDLVPVEEAAVEVVEGEGEDRETGANAERRGAQAEQRWRRRHECRHVRVPLGGDEGGLTRVQLGQGLEIVRHVKPTEIRTETGTRAVLALAVFLVNRRAPTSPRDCGCIFQPELEVTTASLVPRYDLTGFDSPDNDAAIADLHYRDVAEWAVGHGVGAVPVHEAEGPVRAVRTTWLPHAHVERVVPNERIGAMFGMEVLGRLDAGAVHAALDPLVDEYRGWIAARRKGLAGLATKRREVAELLLDDAERAAQRIADGIDLLATSPAVLDAFRLANRTLAAAGRRRRAQEAGPGTDPVSVAPPAWRPFQLAFILLNIPGLVDPGRPDRETVDLLFFPTGGGKTEAYLGLAAFTLVYRRLSRAEPAGYGLAVLMRYTLRLLTLDQLSRAAAVICALELEREQDEARLGAWPFEIGLWVGRAATPNRMGGVGDKDDNCAYRRVMRYKGGKTKELPVPIEACPWCGEKLGRDSFEFHPDAKAPESLVLRCLNRNCDFEGTDRHLPILTVDEPIYRRLPGFLIATVDKFASLPWVGETAAFFGRVGSYDPKKGFSGLPEPGSDGLLAPPDLIIQDELHLISGPLGTMVGLFETALDALATRRVGDVTVRPKIVASTATVRKAQGQVKALFARGQVAVFPPPGPDRGDSFFARALPTDDPGSRLYVGLAAQGRGAKVVFLKALASAMAAAQAAHQAASGANPDPADPYLTALCYFNALRELGSARRIVEGEVGALLASYQRRQHADGLPPLASRTIHAEPLELTSRVSATEVARAKERLAKSFASPERVDVALATNMISVGLDITRLGLMLVAGQPKTTSEYIQATSRVGRDASRPGLVLVLLNLAKPRDRSHYERFCHYHATFYRAVEAMSVTPFSPRALDRGLAAVLVAASRLGHTKLIPPLGAAVVSEVDSIADMVADLLADRAAAAMPGGSKSEKAALWQLVRARARSLFDAWLGLAKDATALGGSFGYAKASGINLPLLREMLEDGLGANQARFRAPRSMRDVEPSAFLGIRDPMDNPLGG